MAAMAPEVASGAAGAVAGRALSPDQGEGSPAAFMVAIVLLGLALVGFWFAFHTPDQWDTSGGQWPGLFGRVLSFMQGKAEPGSQAAAGSGAGGSSNAGGASSTSSKSGGSAVSNAYAATVRAFDALNLAKLPADAATTVTDALAALGNKLGL